MDAVFRRHIQRVRSDGATVLLSSHILGEVEQLCDRVTIIRTGTAVESGSLKVLRHLSRTHFTVLGLSAQHALALLPVVHGVRTAGTGVEFDADAEDLAAVLSALGGAGVAGLAELSPFRHSSAMPVEAFNGTGALLMAAISVAGAGLAAYLLGRRDLTS